MACRFILCLQCVVLIFTIPWAVSSPRPCFVDMASAFVEDFLQWMLIEQAANLNKAQDKLHSWRGASAIFHESCCTVIVPLPSLLPRLDLVQAICRHGFP